MFEASKAHHANQAIAAEEALTAIVTKKLSSKVACVNCNKPDHTKDKCWHSGSGDEGGSPCAHAKKEKDTVLAAKANIVGETKAESETANISPSMTSTMSYPISFYQQDNQLYENNWSFACTDAACSINWLAHQCDATGTPELALTSIGSIP